MYNGLAPDAWAGRLPKRPSFVRGYSTARLERIIANRPAYGFAGEPTLRHGFIAGDA